MLATILISAALVVIVALIIRNMRKKKKNGQSGSCDCSSCAMGGLCHQQKEE